VAWSAAAVPGRRRGVGSPGRGASVSIQERGDEEESDSALGIAFQTSRRSRGRARELDGPKLRCAPGQIFFFADGKKDFRPRPGPWPRLPWA
jgi:hypothetical protein